MSKLSRYWTIVRLNATGQTKEVELPAVYAFFQQRVPDVEQDEADDQLIQARLLALMQSPESEITAALCLRCFISHQIVQICTSLQMQFGNYYGFTLQDLLPYVLSDDGKLPAQPGCLAQQILQSFRPDSSSLATWTARLVRQHRELNTVLVEHGLYLVSDWAILNDTKPEQLRRIFVDFYGLTAVEVDRACLLLESYRSVYLPDRLKQGRGRCSVPTLDQLERISHLIQTKTATVTAPDSLLAQLQRLATRLRQYRIYKRGGPLPVVLIDTPRGHAEVEKQEVKTADERQEPATSDELEETQKQVDFLQEYRQIFLKRLDQALESVVGDRQQKSRKPEKAIQFVTALHLFYCQRISMTAIASQIGLRGQDNVTRLLKLKDFRADVRRHMLKQLQSDISKAAKAYCDPDRLQQFDAQIEAALNEQLEALMQQEAKRVQTPKDLMLENVFTQKLCQYLDRAAQPEQPHE